MREALALISGACDTAVGELPGSTCLGLHAEAAFGAIADAGLVPGDIDGLLCSYSMTEPHLMLASVVAEHLGLQPAHCAALSAGGATGVIAVMQAQALIAAGHCRHVLVVTGDNRLTGMSRDGAVAALAGVGHPLFEQPCGLSVPAAYALIAQRYLHEYGVPTTHLAAVAVAMRRHAARHPKAHKRAPITLDDVLASKEIASPLRLLDCCLISDGAAAVVISAPRAVPAATRARVALLGAGQGHTHEHVSYAPGLREFGCHRASALAFAQAGLTPRDIDVAEIYDSFTITLLVELESMGFFAPGTAGAAALAGALDLDGELPCNTHGGLLSYGHSGPAGGMFHLVEAVHQLRGEAGPRQVHDAALAFVHGDGGILSAHGSLILGAA